MINYPYANLFNKDICKKEWIIIVDGVGALTNAELDSDSIELQESLCSDPDLIYGKCESSILKFTVHEVAPELIGKKLTVSMVLDNHTSDPFSVGTYYVVSDEPTLDHDVRKITAYDALGIVLNIDYSDWYKALSLPMTLKQFRDAFFNHVGITQESTTLIMDNLQVERTIDPGRLSGKDILQAICEINARFGHIGRDNKFRYIKLETIGGAGLYPSDTLYPANDLYPQSSPDEIVDIHKYMNCDYQDYLTSKITKLQIRQEEDDIGAIYGTGNNTYIIEGNFLVYGKSASTLASIAQAVYNEIKDVQYYPINLNKIGDLCSEVGDSLMIVTQDKIIRSYVLTRTFKGIQVLNDNYISKGLEKRDNNVNSVNSDIIQLKGKANLLTRTIEETQSTIIDVERGLQSQITQNAESITAEVTRATGAEGTLSSRITQNATAITAKVDAEYSGSFSWELKSTGFKLKSGSSTVFNCDSTGIEISGKITAKSGYIGNGSSGFTIGNTSIYNGTNSMSSAANGIYLGTDGINLAGNFKVTSAGSMTAKSGYIGNGSSGFTIGNTSIYNGKSSLTASGSGVYIGTDGIAVGNAGFMVTKEGAISIGISASSTNALDIWGSINFKSTGSLIKQGGNELMGYASSGVTFPVAGGYTYSSAYGIYMSAGRLCVHDSWCIRNGSFTATSSKDIIYLSGGTLYVTGAGNVRLGQASGKVGFFGTSPIAKKTVSNATYTSSTTAKTVGDDLNALKTALRDYGLIG